MPAVQSCSTSFSRERGDGGKTACTVFDDAIGCASEALTTPACLAARVFSRRGDALTSALCRSRQCPPHILSAYNDRRSAQYHPRRGSHRTEPPRGTAEPCLGFPDDASFRSECRWT